jgi:gamma-glutamylputrescine oxidase
MKYSFWEKKIITQPADFTIIGAGIVGLSTAISLKEKSPEATVKIIERGSLPYGASTKNAGFCCFGSISELLHDVALMGERACMEVVHMRWDGLQKLRARCEDIAIEYNANQGTELFRDIDKDIREQCIEAIPQYNVMMADYLGLKNTYSVSKQNRLESFDGTQIVNQYEGSINPMEMMNCLLKKARILDIDIHLGVDIDYLDRDNKRIVGNQLEIPYSRLIVCTNGFARQLLHDLEVYPARNQVIMTKPMPNFSLPTCYHVDGGFVYFRSYQNRLLIGGGRNIALDEEATSDFGTTEVIQHYLHELMEKIIPASSSHIDITWSGILGLGPSKYPICSWVDDDLLVGVRMGGMGVAIGSHLGDKLAEMALSKNNH